MSEKKSTLTTTAYTLKDKNVSEPVAVASFQHGDTTNKTAYIVPGYYTAPIHYEDLAALTAEKGIELLPIDIVGAPTIITEPFKKYEEHDIIAAWASASHYAITEHEHTTTRDVEALVGYSLGGAAAVLTALELPHIKKVVLIGPVGSTSIFERALLWLYTFTLTKPLGDALFRIFFMLQVYISVQQTKRDIANNIPALKRFEKTKAETLRKEIEGAKAAGYKAGVAKMRFQLPTYLAALKKRGVSVEFILFDKDHYVSTSSLQKMADRLEIPTQRVPHGHNRLKNRPEDLAPAITKALSR